jgi:hypothetical protein
VVNLVLFLFLFSCVFDPADHLLGLKVWLFLIAFGMTLFRLINVQGMFSLSRELLVYIVMFVGIPMLSILNGMLDGPYRYEGLALINGYLLIFLTSILVLNRVDLMSVLAKVLTVLAVVIVITRITLQVMPDLYPVLAVFGERTGVVILDVRSYLDTVSMMQVYFVTSPMLVISIAWYAQRAAHAGNRSARYAALATVFLHMVAMMLAGSRNNIFMAIALPVALGFLFSRHRAIYIMIVTALVSVLLYVFADQLRALLSPNEVSNNIKLMLLDDYSRILADPKTLMFGTGLGVYEFWNAKSAYYFISELTYLEMVRNFGLPGALLMLGLLLWPVYKEFSYRSNVAEPALAIGWGGYLFMCISNPNLFNSMGILILSVLLGRQYLKRFYTFAPGVAR